MSAGHEGRPPTPTLAAAIEEYHRGEVASFHMPGHKQRGGVHPLAPQVLGDTAIRNDVSEMGGFDYLHAVEAALQQAQMQSAQIFGAQSTFFLVNGSTVGNLAAILSQCRDGDGVTALRGSHRSVYTAIALAGAIPNYVSMRNDRTHDGWFVAMPPTTLPARTRVVHVTRPNYYGMAVDLAPWRALADAHHAVLVVDEAHGSHFGAHPALPRSALQSGADIVIQSTHKTLSALTQASMLHISHEGANRIDVAALAQSLAMLQSSSPSALLTMSLDLAAEEHARNDFAAAKRTVELAEHARIELRNVLRRLRLLDTGDFVGGVGIAGIELDPTKLVIDVGAAGLTGFDARAILRERERIWVELADHRRIVCSITVGDDEASTRMLIDALRSLETDHRPTSTRAATWPELPDPSIMLAPRAALQQPAEHVDTQSAQGRVCAEYVIPYPPGIPLVAPGELLTDDVLTALNRFSDAGARIVGPADATGATLRCVVVATS